MTGRGEEEVDWFNLVPPPSPPLSLSLSLCTLFGFRFPATDRTSRGQLDSPLSLSLSLSSPSGILRARGEDRGTRDWTRVARVDRRRVDELAFPTDGLSPYQELALGGGTRHDDVLVFVGPSGSVACCERATEEESGPSSLLFSLHSARGSRCTSRATKGEIKDVKQRDGARATDARRTFFAPGEGGGGGPAGGREGGSRGRPRRGGGRGRGAAAVHEKSAA